jgi:hypothetical protein
VQQLATTVDCVCERREVFVEFAIGDRVEQHSIGVLGLALAGVEPKRWRGVVHAVCSHGWMMS